MSRGSAKDALLAAPGGVREDLNVAAIPDGQWAAASNWLVRRGVGVPRPGYSQVDSAISSGDRIIGLAFRGEPAIGNLIIHSLTKAFHWDGSSQTDVTGTWTTAAAGECVRMTTFDSGGTTYLLRVNADNAVDKWSGSGNFADATGAPAGVDLFVLSNRVIVVKAAGNARRVQWSDFNDVDTWPAGAFAELKATPGACVAGRAFSPLLGAIYKEDSVWIMAAQEGGAPFRFGRLTDAGGFDVPGPVSPSALVSYGGRHYWLSKDRNVWVTDGQQAERLTAGLVATFEDMGLDNSDQFHGMAMRVVEPELWFWYQEAAATGLTRGFIIKPDTSAIYPATFADAITASAGWTLQQSRTIDELDEDSATIDGLDNVYSTIDSMEGSAAPTAVIGDADGKFYRLGRAVSDDGTAISWSFTTGYRPSAGLGNRLEPDAVVSYWKQTTMSLTVTVGLTLTEDLSDADSEVTGTFDTSTASNHLTEFRDSPAPGQWAKVRHAASSVVSGLEHRGAALLGWPRSMV